MSSTVERPEATTPEARAFYDALDEREAYAVRVAEMYATGLVEMPGAPNWVVMESALQIVAEASQ